MEKRLILVDKMIEGKFSFLYFEEDREIANTLYKFRYTLKHEHGNIS